jgi:uncharacterized protein YjbI with pentapeptide repeats
MAGPDTNTNAPPTPIWGFGPPSPEPDTKKLDALLSSLNGSAERFQTLWFSFLGLTLYLAIAALATTHRNLLLGEPQILPILNIKVELLPFYVIAPLLYLVFHFYLLMMLALLARTAAEFDKQLRTTLPDEPERERYRARIGNALFLQLLVGMKGERTGVNALLMGLIALITIVLAPLATLVLMQMMFLPYHHLRITWWHRGIVVADLVLIVVMTYRCFFPRGVRNAPLVLGALSRKPRWATAMAFCVLLAVALAPLSYWLSFREGRWAGEPWPSSFKEWQQWMAGEPPSFPETNPDYAATAKGVVFGLFPDRLKLNDETIVGEKTFKATKEEIASRGGADFVPTLKLDDRDLQAADFSRVDLRGVSLNGAALQGANLEQARLDSARISCEQQGDSEVCAQLKGTRLSAARLQGADLGFAQLQGASLGGAQLQGARLTGAHLDAAYLYTARLTGADLSRAHLQGADLTSAQLQGANVMRAQLQGADLRGAQLQGVNFSGAQLQGADLVYAQLQGSCLEAAQLQGADLALASMADAEFNEAVFWRTNVADADLSTAAIRSVHTDQVKLDDMDDVQPLAQSDVVTWIVSAMPFARESKKAGIVERFARLKSEFQTGDQDAGDREKWKNLEDLDRSRDPLGANHRQRLAAFLGDLACGFHDAPSVARGLVRQSHLYFKRYRPRVSARLSGLGDQLEVLRAHMEEGRKIVDKCPGVAGFTEDDWRRLEAIKPAEATPLDH